ncbi:MAG TPA: protein kinase, partial [Tepidisphaeraceae bacterium]|nr:protein kinase [Tepidisphaeraceae bacterium]
MKDLDHISGPQLSSLLSVQVSGDGLWDREELKSIWRHQLAAPLDEAVRAQGDGAPGLPIISFADLLRHPSPPVEMLQAMIRRAERWGRDPHQPLPEEIARMIGCAAGAVARVRGGKPVVPDDQLVRELSWAVRQDWPDASTRMLLADALDRFEGNAADPSPATPSIPGYEVLGCLGQGGMGSVWRARQVGSGRQVAIKVLHASNVGSERARARFAREIELASSLNHPNIARVYDSQIGSHLCFYSMELIEGVPLDEYARSMSAGRDQVVALVECVCRAVQHAHEQGVIHRDLKPSNILVDSAGQPHVLDFGLAKAAGADAATLLLSMEGELTGTLGYMAPEQASGAGGQADTRSDVYSLGAILYQLLLGRLPSDTSGQRWDVAQRIASGQIARPRAIDPSLDAELEAILLKALSLERQSRYGSAGELAADLARYRRDEPLAARPPTLGYFAGKWVQRRRIPLAIAAAVVVSLLGTAIVSYIRVAVARSEAVSAQHLEAQARQLAEQRRMAAEAARHEAVLNAAKADEMRRTAELRLAEGLVAQGDAMAQGNRWVEAKELYREAGNDFEKMGLSRMPADLGLLNAYRTAPPPLLELRGHRGPVMQTAFSPDGTLAASAGTDGAVCVWDLRRGRLMYRLTGHTSEVTCVAFSPDQRLLVSGSNDLTARLWDLSTGTCLRQIVVGNQLRSVTFSPRGTWCAAGTDYQPLMWEVATGRKVCLHGLENRVVWTQRFSADGRTCLVCGGHDHMELQDATTGRVLRSIHTGVVTYAAAYSADGKLLLTGHGAGGGDDPIALLWDTQNWRVVRAFTGPTGSVTSVAFSPDQKHVFGGSEDGNVFKWDISGGPPIAITYGDTHPLRNTSISADCELALTGDQDGAVRLWDLQGDRGMDAMPAVNGALSIACSADGRLAAAGGPDGLSIFDVPTRRELYRVPSERYRWFVAMSPDGRLALSGDNFAGVHLLNIATAGESSIPRCPSYIRGADFSRDG